MTKPSREDYMERRCSHRDYYGSLVEELGVQFTSPDHIERFKRSRDPHMNDIPLRFWDGHGAMLRAFHGPKITQAFKARGDFVTPAGLVCLYKEAARRAVEASKP